MCLEYLCIICLALFFRALAQFCHRPPRSLIFLFNFFTYFHAQLIFSPSFIMYSRFSHSYFLSPVSLFSWRNRDFLVHRICDQSSKWPPSACRWLPHGALLTLPQCHHSFTSSARCLEKTLWKIAIRDKLQLLQPPRNTVSMWQSWHCCNITASARGIRSDYFILTLRLTYLCWFEALS